MISDNLEGHDDMVIFLVWGAQMKMDANTHPEWKRNQPSEETKEREDRLC